VNTRFGRELDTGVRIVSTFLFLDTLLPSSSLAISRDLSATGAELECVHDPSPTEGTSPPTSRSIEEDVLEEPWLRSDVRMEAKLHTD
jgi:hypothetical protein